jgi:hypothetical protein
MSQTNDIYQRALEYIRNTGGTPSREWFDDDHEPIGPALRTDLLKAGLIEESDGLVRLTAAGKERIDIDTK